MRYIVGIALAAIWWAALTYVVLVWSGRIVGFSGGGGVHRFASLDVSVWNGTSDPLAVTITNLHVPPEGVHARWGFGIPLETFVPATTEPELIPPGALKVINLFAALAVDDPEVHFEVRASSADLMGRSELADAPVLYCRRYTDLELVRARKLVEIRRAENRCAETVRPPAREPSAPTP